jgi:GDP/UDP-N,N'-diacetylbacillosamine 2-epimerase (hydrolysing)
MKKICVITATRAEYGLLKNFLYLIKKNKKFKLDLLITGTHLEKNFGNTIKEIKKDGFKDFRKLKYFFGNDSILSITKSVGFAMVNFGKIFSKIKPDLIVVLGDRYELISVCYAATLAKIPICHFQGGEQTQGIIDDATRNCVTKLSHIHFAATKKYKKRIIQMGENPRYVFNVGGLGAENIKKEKIISKKLLKKKYHIDFSTPFCLATFHPETLSNVKLEFQMKPLLEVLSELKNLNIIFTSPNADPGYKKIMLMIQEFIKKKTNTRFYIKSFGKDYYSILAYSEFLIGNSSSGILEYPSFKKPTINIGDRQNGREKAISIIDCSNNKKSIENAIKKSRSKIFLSKLKSAENVYENGATSQKSLKILEKIDYKNILIKKFRDIKILK